MAVCEICGDRGFLKRLINCVECRDANVHRYCVLGPAIMDDDEYKWSCEDCLAVKTEPTQPCKKSERLRSTVERLAIRNKARKKWRNNVCPPRTQNQSGATDQSVLDQKTKDVCVQRKQLTLKENRNSALHHVSNTTEVVMSATGVGNEDSIDGNTFNAYERGRGETLLDQSSCKIHSELLEEVNKNSCRDDSERQSLKKKRVDKGMEYLKEVPNFAVAKHSNFAANIGKFTSSQSSSKDTSKLSDDHFPRLISVESLSSQPSAMKTDDSERQSLKRKRVITEMEHSNEESDFVIAKHLKLVANGGKFMLSKEILSKSSDDGLPQLVSVESVPLRPSLTKIDDCVLTREPSVMFDYHVSAQLSTVKLVNHVPAQPLHDVAWRGFCSIRDYENERPVSLVLEGHLSNKAAEKEHGLVHALPEGLTFDFVPKKYALPRNTVNLPLPGNVIDVYFFPVNERDEKFYECIIGKMTEHDLALKSNINNVELLCFCSLELPQEQRSFRRKYYLWGVFSPRKVLPNAQSPVTSQYQNTLSTIRKILGPVTPFPSFIRVRQEHVKLSDESIPLQQPQHNQEYSSQQKDSENRRVSCRQDYSRNSWKPRDAEHHRIFKFSDDADRCYINLLQNGRVESQKFETSTQTVESVNVLGAKHSRSEVLFFKC